MSLEFWITTFAIVVGPLGAVLIAHHLQERRERTNRRLHVFRLLMATRKAPISIERVQALNLVEIEFYGEQEVSKKFSALLETYNDVGRWKSEDPDVRRRVFQDVEDQVADLLNELGRVLGYRLEQIKLLRGGYYPEAFSVRDVQEAEIREFIQQLKRGEKAVPIDVLDVRHPRKILEQARETNEVLSAAALDEVKQEGAR